MKQKTDQRLGRAEVGILICLNLWLHEGIERLYRNATRGPEVTGLSDSG